MRWLEKARSLRFIKHAGFQGVLVDSGKLVLFGTALGAVLMLLGLICSSSDYKAVDFDVSVEFQDGTPEQQAKEQCEAWQARSEWLTCKGRLAAESVWYALFTEIAVVAVVVVLRWIKERDNARVPAKGEGL